MSPVHIRRKLCKCAIFVRKRSMNKIDWIADPHTSNLYGGVVAFDWNAVGRFSSCLWPNMWWSRRNMCDKWSFFIVVVKFSLKRQYYLPAFDVWSWHTQIFYANRKADLTIVHRIFVSLPNPNQASWHDALVIY